MGLKFKSRVPVTLIGGFLGAGKTTLVNHLVSNANQRYGVIVNEFGEVGIDGALIENLDTDGIAELSNGCLCCVAKDDLLSAMFKMVSRPQPPDYLLIELSGIADPVPVAQTVLDPFAKAKFELDGIVGVADALNLERTLQESPEGAVQMAYASVVVLNKTDLAIAESLEAARNLIARFNPLAQVHPAKRGAIDPKEVLNLKAFSVDWQPQGYQHRHLSGVSSFVLQSQRTLKQKHLNRFIDQYLISRPDQVFRAKGFLSVEGYTQKVIFQGVREVFDLGLSDQASDGSSQLVVIGRNLDQAEFAKAFAACA